MKGWSSIDWSWDFCVTTSRWSGWWDRTPKKVDFTMAVFEGRPLKPKIHSDQRLLHQERTEMKRRRETAQFFQYQQRLLNIGAPKMDSRRWGNIYIYICIFLFHYVFFFGGIFKCTHTYIYIYIYILGLFLTFTSCLWLCEGLNIIMTNNSNNTSNDKNGNDKHNIRAMTIHMTVL